MVLILLTLVFLLLRVAPGNPIQASLGGHVPPSVVKPIEHRLGFDKPLITQYGDYLWNIMRGNLGTTITDNRPLSQIIKQNGAATLELTFFAMLIAIVVGVLVASLPAATATPPSTLPAACSASSSMRRLRSSWD